MVISLVAACGPGRRPAPVPAPAPAAAPGPVGEAPRGEGLPPVPARTGPLAIDVVYPAEGAQLAASDSNFIFGSVGTGGARLTINGAAVEVAPNGAFLGFLPVPPNGVYDVVASASGQQATLRRTVRVPARQAAPAAGGELAFVSGSIGPRGVVTVAEGEVVEVRFRATPGARARIVFPDGTSIPLAERVATERDEGFQQDLALRPREFTEYAGSFPANLPLVARDREVGAATLVGPRAGAGTAMLELVRGTDTVRAPLELSLGVLRAGEARVGVAAGQRADGTVIATAIPGGGTPYHWFFPNGTRFTITGERAGAYRVRLAEGQTVWVAANEVRLLPPGTPLPAGTVAAVRLAPSRDWVDVRLTVSDRLPFEVRADSSRLVIDVYGAETRTNWLHYGPEDPFVRRVEWSQPADDRYR
ncbi:MAG TPA: hypothetical protein VF746_02470, partial [Longimicrobium sp.]